MHGWWIGVTAVAVIAILVVSPMLLPRFTVQQSQAQVLSAPQKDAGPPDASTRTQRDWPVC